MGRLQSEIRQRTPFATAAQEATLSLLRTADVVRRRVAAVIEPAGISPQQYNVLRILRGVGPAGLPTLEIADRLVERAPGITRLCDGLERAGYLTREREDGDRRVVRCRISRSGLGLLARLDAPVAAADRGAVAPLSAPEITTLIALLDRIREQRPADTAGTPSRPKGR